MEGRNVGTIGGKSPKQGLISAKDLPIELSEGHKQKKWTWKGSVIWIIFNYAAFQIINDLVFIKLFNNFYSEFNDIFSKL